mmetsp:Transcript_1417/g.3342  ORF Transcript_1417/g.3342 Transcript_1417/m.3342 type:complete len:855 (+) Transcript_1417:24-2588(+)
MRTSTGSRYVKLYSEEAAHLLQSSLDGYEEASSASAAASPAAGHGTAGAGDAAGDGDGSGRSGRYAPLAGRGASGVLVLGIRGGSATAGAATAGSTRTAAGDGRGAGAGAGAGAISAISSGALSSDEEDDDDDDEQHTGDDSSSSGGDDDHALAAAAAGPLHGGGYQSGAATDDYDASASSAGEMSVPTTTTAGGGVASAQSTCTLPPRRGNGSSAGRTISRRERERLERRTTKQAAAAAASASASAGGSRYAGERGGQRYGPNIGDLVRNMGSPPSVLVPLPQQDDDDEDDNDEEDGEEQHEQQRQQEKQQQEQEQEQHQQAAAIPTALLPPGNADWTPISICRTCLDLNHALRIHNRPVIVLLLRSGRFAGGVFVSRSSTSHDDGTGTTTATSTTTTTSTCLHHRVCARYTVRRGQGGAQSALDGSKGKARSTGAQLRRAGEASLRHDVATTLAEWRTYIDNAALILLSCPKTMRRGLHEEGKTSQFLSRNDGRIRKVPLDVGRPTYESVCAVYEIMTSITVRHLSERERIVMERGGGGGGTSTGGSASFDLSTEEAAEGDRAASSKAKAKDDDAAAAQPRAAKPKPVVPLTPLHEAAAAADIIRLTELLSLNDVADETVQNDDNDGEHNNDDNKDEGEAAAAADMIDSRAGADLQTPLHLAASLADQDLSVQCVTALLVQGRANPCVVDGRNRPPYFVAEHERVRDAFRSARAVLGEEHCDWDGGAKVPPALTQDDVQRKKDKAAEKKRRQRARQKERKAAERAEEEARMKKEKEEAEARKQEEDAKRIRAGLKPKTTTASNACDYCQKVCRGKSRAQMFSRLEFVYCSTDCVRKHQRELTAAAATARFGG